MHPVADERGVEKGETAQVGQHQVVGLGEKCGDHGLAAHGRMVIGELVAERRLADAG